MYIETVPNRNSPPAILLREGWREGGKVKKRTLANLSKWPETKVDTLRRLLRNEPLVGREEAFDIVRSRPHGHVAAVLGTLRKLRLERVIAGADSPERRRVLAMIVARVLEPRSDAYPGERLMVCRNPLLAEERARKREALLRATEALLDPIVAAARREQRRLKGADKIGVRVGKVVGKYKMAKHFELDIEEDAFGYRRKPESIAAEAALDGLYVVRTSLPASELDAEGAVRAYKRLSAVERAFRSLKTVDLKVRPVFHRTADRVRAHVFLCMLAYYVEWHMRARLKPLLFDDHDPAAAAAARASIVAPAKVSEAAKEKARGKRTADGLPVHSFRTLLRDLATITRNRVVPRVSGAVPFEVLTRPTALQREAFKLLGG